MRHLKHHEQKLLKKTDFLHWRGERNIREAEILRKYHIHKRDDYQRYNRVCGLITKLANKLASLPATEPFRIKVTEQLLNKLYHTGVIPMKKSLSQCAKVPASAIARRRLPVVLVKLKFCETMKEATEFVEQGHIRIGPDVVTDPSLIVPRSMEDFITWVSSSSIKKKVQEYHGERDDFELLGS